MQMMSLLFEYLFT